MKPFTLYPSILSASIIDAQREVMWISAVPEVRTLQIDIADGQFVDNLTITPTDMAEIDFGEMSLDLHLMTEEPVDYVYEAIEFKDQLPIRGIIAQIERMSSQEFYIETARKQLWQVGLSIDLFTPLESIEDQSWEDIDILQIMGIEAGFQGQEFQDQALKKIEAAAKKIEKLDRNIELIVDGGVKKDLVKTLSKAGANGFVVGSGLWQSDNILEAAESFLERSKNE